MNYFPPDNALRQLSKPTPADPNLLHPACVQKRQLPVSSSAAIPVPIIPATSSVGIATPTPTAAATSSSESPALSTPSATPPKLFGTGPLSLSVAPFAQAFGTYMIGSLHELGIKETTSFNGGVLAGGTVPLSLELLLRPRTILISSAVQFAVTTIQQALGKVVRSTSRSSFLREAEAAGREKTGQLVVVTRALVKKIVRPHHSKLLFFHSNLLSL